MSSVYHELDKIRTELKNSREQLKKAHTMIDELKVYNIHTKDDLINRMGQYQHYKNRAGKYNRNVKRLQKLREFVGEKKYKEIIKC